jgi:hypothetical protein
MNSGLNARVVRSKVKRLHKNMSQATRNKLLIFIKLAVLTTRLLRGSPNWGNFVRFGAVPSQMTYFDCDFLKSFRRPFFESKFRLPTCKAHRRCRCKYVYSTDCYAPLSSLDSKYKPTKNWLLLYSNQTRMNRTKLPPDIVHRLINSAHRTLSFFPRMYHF